MKKIFVIGAVLALFTTAASAQAGHDVIERQRIHNGFETGQLTRGEKFRLNREQNRYRHEKRRAGRDGRITPRERRKLAHMRHRENRRTYYMKHNARKRMF